MTVEPELLAFAGVVFVGYAVQTITGFAFMLLCVTFGALFLPIADVLTLSVPLSVLQTAYIAIRHHRHVQFRLLFTRVLPVMLVGMGCGYAGYRVFGGPWLPIVFSILVCVLASRELWRLHGPARSEEDPEPLRPAAALMATVAAGLVHGVYATGGPLLVYVVGRGGLSKGEVRATLSFVWLSLNVLLVAGFVLEGRYDGPTLSSGLILLPAIPLGLLVGEWLHDRVSEQMFRSAMFTLLLAASLALFVKSVWA